MNRSFFVSLVLLAACDTGPTGAAADRIAAREFAYCAAFYAVEERVVRRESANPVIDKGISLFLSAAVLLSDSDFVAAETKSAMASVLDEIQNPTQPHDRFFSKTVERCQVLAEKHEASVQKRLGELQEKHPGTAQ